VFDPETNECISCSSSNFTLGLIYSWRVKKGNVELNENTTSGIDSSSLTILSESLPFSLSYEFEVLVSLNVSGSVLKFGSAIATIFNNLPPRGGFCFTESVGESLDRIACDQWNDDERDLPMYYEFFYTRISQPTELIPLSLSRNIGNGIVVHIPYESKDIVARISDFSESAVYYWMDSPKRTITIQGILFFSPFP